MPDTEKLVTISRLKALLDAYGAAPECWPEEERAAATALIETSPEARILVEEADALDSLLDKIPEPEVSAALTSRVRSMALPAIEAKSGGMFSRLAAFLQPDSRLGWQGAVAMAGVLGIVAGIGVSPLWANTGVRFIFKHGLSRVRRRRTPLLALMSFAPQARNGGREYFSMAYNLMSSPPRRGRL